MTLRELLNRRLILISGKGGVGKTTVAVALGLLAASLKKKTLLVEMNSTERIAPYFNLKEIGHEEIPLSPYLTGINLKPADCFEEYVLMQVRFKKIFDTFINNRFVTYFLNAIPGFNDLLMIGKIYDLEQKKKGRISSAPLYDLIIVDGPSTGHGVSSFEVPTVVSRAVKIGPIKNQAERINGLLRNSDKTVFTPVTLAEEMPVAETGELISHIRQKLKIALGPVFVNNFFESPVTEDEEERMEAKMPDREDVLYPYFAYALLARRRSKLNEHYRQKLAGEHRDLKLITIPHIEGALDKARDLESNVEEWLKEVS